MKKKKRGQNQPPSDAPEDASESLGPPPGRKSTFEELMEEFTTGKPIQRAEPVEIIQEVEEIPVAEPGVEDIKKQRKLETKKYSMIKDTVGRSDGFKIVEEETSIYSDLLKEPDGPKKAFVLSEIFNKKF